LGGVFIEFFKKKGEITRFQILAEIAKGEPHLRQKDIAHKLDITVQAVSENIKNLVDEGFVEMGSGSSRYKITKRGIEKVKREAVNIRKYADQVLDTMNTYKSVWPALAEVNLEKGDKVWLRMDDGILYVNKKPTSAHAEVLHAALEGEDVALSNLGGTIELDTGSVVIIKLPPINLGGSRSTDLKKIEYIYKKYPIAFDRVGVMGTVSRAVTNKLHIKIDFEFATPEATVAAAKRGLNILVFAVGNMTRSLTRRMDEEGIKYSIEDAIIG
jgi:putative transcriptional regulator